jgi:transcription elongation regulator 1
LQTAATKGDAKREAEFYNEIDEKIVGDEQEARKRSEKDKQAKELYKAQDKSRPVSSTPVPGTPW